MSETLSDVLSGAILYICGYTSVIKAVHATILVWINIMWAELGVSHFPNQRSECFK